MIDIVIPVYNNLNLTHMCLASLCRFADTSFRVIVVNDGSTDDTEPWLVKIQKDILPNLVQVVHDKREGFTKSVNDGMSIAQSSYVMLLNNDTLFFEPILKKLIETFDYTANVGMVAPTSNSVIGRQNVMFNDGVTKWESVPVVSGFCVVMPRGLIESLGMWDEDLDPILGSGASDIDFCIRLANAGKKIIINRQTYIWHERNMTLNDMPEYKSGEYQDYHYKKAESLVNKWGQDWIDQFKRDGGTILESG